MFMAQWLILIAVSGQTQMATVTDPARFASIELCRAHVESHASRIPDIVRGGLHLGWDAEIAVKGECAASGRDA